jgi:cytochrome P450
MAEVPVRAVASLLGFADERLAEVAGWMGRFVACLSPLSGAAQIASAHEASVELLAALRELMAAPGGLREGSLVQAVWREAVDTGWREERAILANLVGLMSQTSEATAGLIGNTLVALQRGAPWPLDEASALRLVREVAVNDPPVQNTRRFVAEDAHIGGVDVKQGQVILVVLAAAGKGFGHGAHACPGQAIAETIASAAITSLPGPPGPMRWRYRPSVNARIPEFLEAL